MGTTSDKLTYLNGTKSAIKDSINLGGGTLTTEPFRQYASAIKDRYLDFMNNGTDTVWNNWNKVNGSGTSITLNNTEYAPMKLEYGGNTSQDTNYPLPSGYTRYTSVDDTNGTTYTATSTQIPAKRNSDNVFGLYNISTNTFTTEV